MILGDVRGGVRTTYRICANCWVALGDACPRAVKTDEDALTHWILDTLAAERARGKHPGVKDP